MGYYAYSIESDFRLRKEKQPAATASLRKLFSEKAQCRNLSEMIEAYGFTVYQDDLTVDIADLFFEYQKYYEDSLMEMLSTLAPFVEEGSYLAFHGEDDSLWAFYFNGQDIQEYAGVIVYPGMPASQNLPVYECSTGEA